MLNKQRSMALQTTQKPSDIGLLPIIVKDSTVNTTVTVRIEYLMIREAT